MAKKVSFKLASNYVGEATAAFVVGEFNNWNVAEGIQMEKAEDGSMVAEILLTPGKTYEYRYLLNDGRWVNDDNEKKTADAFGHVVENCVVSIPAAAEKPKKVIKVAAPKAENVKVKVVAAKAEKNTKAEKAVKEKVASDDLTKIKGVTKKIEAVLQADGIMTFNDLGKCTMKKLLLILESASLNNKTKFHTTWSKQAKLAAADKWEALAALQEEIKA